MINLTEEEILDYLLTSDLNEDLSPDELKSLILKFRNFYRIAANRFHNIELAKKKFDLDLETLKAEHTNNINEINYKKGQIIQAYTSLITRKLTFKERFFGKLLPKNDELI